MATPDRSPAKPSIGLFTGAAGFELGLRKGGFEPVLFAENDAAARQVLAHHFPAVELLGDVRDIADLRPRALLLAAAFPGQDLSPAGRKTGMAGRDAPLMHELFRLLKTQPIEWVILEQVPFAMTLQDGAAIREILSRLEILGYRWAYRIVNAWHLGLPQRRRRVLIVGARTQDPRAALLADDAGPVPERPAQTCDIDKHVLGFYQSEGRIGCGWAVDGIPPLRTGTGVGIPSPPALLFPNGMVAMPAIEDAERLQGLPTGFTSPSEAVARSARWRLTSNTTSIPMSEWIGARIDTPGSYDATKDEALGSGQKLPDAAWNMGGGAHRSRVSDNPLGLRPPKIGDFLRYPLQPLSARACDGFLKRARMGRLRFPARFLERIARHANAVRQETPQLELFGPV